MLSVGINVCKVQKADLDWKAAGHLWQVEGGLADTVTRSDCHPVVPANGVQCRRLPV